MYIIRHNDLPGTYRVRTRNQQAGVDLHDPEWGPNHTDIPRLQEGMVGAVVKHFLNKLTGQSSRSLSCNSVLLFSCINVRYYGVLNKICFVISVLVSIRELSDDDTS